MYSGYIALDFSYSSHESISLVTLTVRRRLYFTRFFPLDALTHYVPYLFQTNQTNLKSSSSLV